MKIFLTGATGYIGSVVAEKLLEKHHQIIGLARSGDSAKKLEASGFEVVFGDLDDLDILTGTAQKVDGVIHTAFKQNEKGLLVSMENEQKAVGALLEGIKNSGKPIIYTSGTGLLGDTGSTIFDETMLDRFNPGNQDFEGKDEMTKVVARRIETESDVLSASGVRGIVLRPPNVYGRSNIGLTLFTSLIEASKKNGAVPYTSSSSEHQWSFIHVDDLADLYVLALEKSKGGELYYAATETALKTKDIAQALSFGLGYEGKTIAVEMDELIKIFGGPSFMTYFWTWNNQTSNEKAKRLLNWQPKHIQMLEEIAKPIV